MSERLRALGEVETQLALLQSEGGGTTQGSQVSTVRGVELDAESVRRAARVLFERYALLRCSIEQDGDRLWFVRHNDFERIQVRSFAPRDEASIRAIVIDETNELLDARSACWRLAVLACPEPGLTRIVFTCHHAIIDGVGYYAFLRELLALLDTDCSDQALPSEARQDAFPPAMDDGLGAGAARNGSGVAPHAMIGHLTQAALPERRTVFERASISAAEYGALERFCKERSLAMNSVIGAAAAMATVQTGLAGANMGLRTAISVRERVQGNKPFQLGCNIAFTDSVVEFADNTLEGIARAYERDLLKQILRRGMKRGEIDLERFRARLQRGVAAPFFVMGVALTNVGRVDVPERYQNFELVDYYAVSNVCFGNVFCLITAAEFHGEGRFLFSYTTPLVSQAAISTYIAGFLGHLQGAARSERATGAEQGAAVQPL